MGTGIDNTLHQSNGGGDEGIINNFLDNLFLLFVV